jgi:hypothetical protein
MDKHTYLRVHHIDDSAAVNLAQNLRMRRRRWALSSMSSIYLRLGLGLGLGCSVISIAFIICKLNFFTYVILAGLHYLCRG